MTELKLNDFEKSDIYDYEANAELWGTDNEIGVECYGSTLEDMLPKINRLLGLIDSGREKIVAALLEKNYLSLAEDWASSAEESEDEEDCYIMEDGTEVRLPITAEDFAKSLKPCGISVYAEEDTKGISASFYVMCEPDYFAGHCIQIFLDGDFTIDVNGLAG